MTEPIDTLRDLATFLEFGIQHADRLIHTEPAALSLHAGMKGAYTAVLERVEALIAQCRALERRDADSETHSSPVHSPEMQGPAVDQARSAPEHGSPPLPEMRRRDDRCTN